MFKRVMIIIVGMQISTQALGAGACESFFSQETIINQSFFEKDGLCIAGEKMVSSIQDAVYAGKVEDENYGEVSTFASFDSDNSLVIVSDDLASMMDPENQVVTFVVAIVAIDLGLLGAWMITDMYTK